MGTAQSIVRRPVVAVVGTTGVGKSKLAIQIAQAINGQIVNGDSMQVYQGLDIATNKPTALEKSLVPHHLFSFIESSQEYSVSQFSQDAQKVIDSIHSQSQTPVIVGGTNYYIQSLLWSEAIIQSAPTPGSGNMPPLREMVSTAHAQSPGLVQDLLEALEASDSRLHTPSEIATYLQLNTLHPLLMRIDPDMSNRWHPKDYRKIRRSIEIFLVTGKPHSIWIREQAEDSKKNFQRNLGFKEFDAYFGALESSGPVKQDVLDRAREVAVDDMKVATRRYARKQVTWIRNKLAPACLLEHSNGHGAFYMVDATSLEEWDMHVRNPAIQLVKSFIETGATVDPYTVSDAARHTLPSREIFDAGYNGSCSTKPSCAQADNPSDSELGPLSVTRWGNRTCDVCTDASTGLPRVLHGEHEWKVHITTRGHRRRATGQFKKPPSNT
ncbi:tRNA dimethylallyltransferase [Batrachochytrium salamandrivorans]|nr:tRNA dimethylallyltransferase [Batrachochytrium salamandrivorans]